MYGTKCLATFITVSLLIKPTFNLSSAISRKDGYILFQVCRAYTSVNIKRMYIDYVRASLFDHRHLKATSTVLASTL